VLSSGVVQCWGYNGTGQLGNGSTANSTSAVSVSGIGNATLVSTGLFNTCVVLNSGAAQCWGANDAGQLGNGSTTSSSSPVNVSGISIVTSISVGAFHNCAVLSNGAELCWGSSGRGQLGNGSKTDSTVPVRVVGINNSVASDADKVFAYAEKINAQVFSPSGQASQTILGYRYRAYSGGRYLAVNVDSGTPRLYFYEPFSGKPMLDLGLLADLVNLAAR
jgi:alpha-tubulin suppressor-like RCC1 family protein